MHDADYWINEVKKEGGQAYNGQKKGKPDPNTITIKFSVISDKHPSKDKEPEPQKEPFEKCKVFVNKLKEDGWNLFPPRNPIDWFVVPTSAGWETIAAFTALITK